MPEFATGEIEPFDPAHHPHHQQYAAGQCRFAPSCGNQPDFDGCPGNPAVIDEALGGATGGPKRFMPLCMDRAIRRHGIRAVEQTLGGDQG